MCGINGIFAYHRAASRPSRDELIATRDYMAARGPDGAGYWSDESGKCLLGHRRLAIVDLSEQGSQPMTSQHGHHVVTYNGEIYNYPELRRELEGEGVVFRTAADTEILLHLYARKGAMMLGRLRGMFAFAIWDERRQGLLLARDPYGIKPLYTANDGWTLRFASQVKALLAGGGLSRDREPAGLVGYHLFGHVPDPFTLYRDIRALPAGHYQWIDAGGAREPVRYFNLAEKLVDARGPAPATPFEVTLRHALRESVSAHLLADVEVGLFLSSGLDSAALVAALGDLGRRNIPAITLGFSEYEGKAADEVPLATDLAERYGARSIVRRVNEAEFRDDLPSILEAMDQPSIDGINSWFVAKAARERGLKVALSGLGGDELLGGYPSFKDLPRWRRRYGAVARVPGAGLAARLAFRTFGRRFAAENPKAPSALALGGGWGAFYLLRRGLFMPSELADLMEPAQFRDGLRRLEAIAMLENALHPDPGSDMARVATLESRFYMGNQLLRDADWAGMAHSLEIRVPFVDAWLLRSVAPYFDHVAPPAGKQALSRTPERPLPAEVTDRPKTGFTVPVDRWTGSAAESGPGRPNGVASRRWSRVVLESCAA
jgi:asparagine synthase (glutamine-hydrolysing)